MARASVLFLCLAVIAGAWVCEARSEAEEAPTLAALVVEALEKSAELAAMRARVVSAEAEVLPAGALLDPMASVGLNNIPVGELRWDRDMMSSVGVMLSQRVTAGVRRRLRVEVQRGEVAALRARYQSMENGIVRQVKQAYFDLQYLDEALQIAEENKRLAQDLLAVAESLYATGRVGQQDVFQSQVQLTRMVDAVVALRRQRGAAATRLNRLLYRPPEQAVPGLPALSQTPFVERGVNAESLLQENSLLRESLARLDQAQDRVRLTAQWPRPDYVLTFGYMFRSPVGDDPISGEDMWSASIGIDLPWVNRKSHESEVSSAQAQRQGFEQDVEAQLNAILALIEELTIEIQRTKEQLSLLETGLLPQAEGALAASRAAYATGGTDSVSVLTNQLSLYYLQLERLQLLRDHEQNLAELEHQIRGALQPMNAMLVAPRIGIPAMGMAASAPPPRPSSSGMGAAMSH